MKSVLGYTPEDIIGMSPFDLMPEEEADRLADIIGPLFASRQLFHTARLNLNILDPLVLEKLSLVGGYRDTLLIVAIVYSICIIISLVITRK